MPKIILPVPETNESVTRPIVFDITRQLLVVTKLPANTAIFYPGDLEKTMQSGSAIDQKEELNIAPFSARLSIEVEETYEQDRLTSTAVFRPENLFVFRDDRIETSIKPTYSSTDVVINFRYRAVDKVAATRWRDDIRTHVSMSRDTYLHDITYHYLVPEEFLVILKELYRMREAVAGYGETYDQYFQANITQRASLLTTLAGTQPAWGVAERQMRITGWFDFDGAPELGSKEDEGDTWTVSFSYKFKYDKPIACVLTYPLMVHNQLVNQRFRPDELLYELDAQQRSYSLSALNFHSFEKGVHAAGVPQGFAIPNYDEFLPSSTTIPTLRVLTALTSIDLSNPLFLLSLKDLGDIELHPEIVKFLIGEAPYLTNLYQSVFNISLYGSCDLQPPHSLTIDSGLNVQSTVTLNLRNYYHVRLSLVTNLALLSEAALNRLRKHGIAMLLILNAIDPSLFCKGLLPDFIGSLITSNGTSGSGSGVGGNMGSGASDGINWVSKVNLQKATDEINRLTLASGNKQIYQYNTVTSLFIQSFKNTF